MAFNLVNMNRDLTNAILGMLGVDAKRLTSWTLQVNYDSLPTLTLVRYVDDEIGNSQSLTGEYVVVPRKDAPKCTETTEFGDACRKYQAVGDRAQPGAN